MVERPTGGEQESNFPKPPHIRAEVRSHLTPNAEFIKSSGWDSLAELLFDRVAYLDKPGDPSIPKDDLEAREKSFVLSTEMGANNWEAEVLENLEGEGLGHLVEPFKQQMQEYRKTIKAVVNLWRESGLL